MHSLPKIYNNVMLACNDSTDGKLLLLLLLSEKLFGVGCQLLNQKQYHSFQDDRTSSRNGKQKQNNLEVFVSVLLKITA